MLNPSRVEVAAPAPVMLVPTKIAPATPRPPAEITTAPVLVLEEAVALEKVTIPELV
jgi:hypothetical protein